MDGVRAALTWIYAQRKAIRRWIIRAVAFYFGYKILHREIYVIDHPEPLLIALGLWLCGIAPADIFDGLRKVGDEVGKNIDQATGADQIPPTAKRESSSGDQQA